MKWLRRLWERLFRRSAKALPTPTPTEALPDSALGRWYADYARWLEEAQEMFGRFPDQGALEGETFGEAEGRLLEDITTLYAEQACEVVEQMVLRGEMLRRRLAAKGRK